MLLWMSLMRARFTLLGFQAEPHGGSVGKDGSVAGAEASTRGAFETRVFSDASILFAAQATPGYG